VCDPQSGNGDQGNEERTCQARTPDLSFDRQPAQTGDAIGDRALGLASMLFPRSVTHRSTCASARSNISLFQHLTSVRYADSKGKKPCWIEQAVSPSLKPFLSSSLGCENLGLHPLITGNSATLKRVFCSPKEVRPLGFLSFRPALAGIPGYYRVRPMLDECQTTSSIDRPPRFEIR